MQTFDQKMNESGGVCDYIMWKWRWNVIKDHKYKSKSLNKKWKLPHGYFGIYAQEICSR